MTVQATPRSERRRPRRIAADEAHAWARNLRLGNPYAKLVLCMLTLYVNGDGHCFVSVNQLADDCEFAVETVRRRLAWLETIGAVARLAQWVDEHGRRNSEGRGRRTSDEIRLLIDVDPDEIEARACGVDPPLPEGGQDIASDSADPPASPLPAPSLRPGAESLEPEPELEESPLPPKGGDAQRSPDSENRKAASWSRFETAWQEPILRQSIARQVWSALTEAEEEIAIKAAKGYVVHRRSQKKPPNVINAHTFLRERDAWAGFAALAPPDIAPADPPMFEAEGSESWQARRVIAAIRDEPPPASRPIEGYGKGEFFRKQLSPQSLALAQFAIEHEGKIDTREWLIVKAGTNPCGAWREFLGVDPYNVRTGETKPFMIMGRLHENWPVTIHGIRVPCEWPPRKDGTLSSTGPPVAA